MKLKGRKRGHYRRKPACGGLLRANLHVAVVAPVVAMVAQAPARAAPARAVPLERPARAQIAIKFLAFSEWQEAEGTP